MKREPLSGVLVVRIALAAAVWFSSTVLAQQSASAQVSADISAKELERLQQQVTSLIPKLLPTVVSVGSGGASGGASGVLISKDGLILTQMHVSHIKGRKPGDEVDIVFLDGQRRKARLLGAHGNLDISLVKLSDPGPYPFTAISRDAKPKLGDLTLSFGHPGGYETGRQPVARLGRILFAGKTKGVTDCMVDGGDSGGPRFDLSGNLIGIPHLSNIPGEIHGQGRPRGVVFFSYTSVTAIAEQLDTMMASKMIAVDQDEYRKVSDAEYSNGRVLPTANWTQGAQSLAPWKSIAKKAGAHVVQIEWKGRRLALGTVVGEKDLVITKASQITSHPDVRTASGELLAAEIVGVNAMHDIALLKVKGLKSPGAVWSKQPTPPVGTLLMAPSPTGTPIVAGIVSVPRRTFKGPYPDQVKMAPLPQVAKALPPEIIGSPVPGRGYWIDHVEGTALVSGLEVGDLLVSIEGYAIRKHEDLMMSVANRAGGDVVKLTIQRGSSKKTLSVTLPTLRTGTIGRMDSVASWSLRTTGFPVILECDLPLNSDECGGPVVSLDGSTIGIVIARRAHGSVVIPGDVIQGLLPQLMKGDPRNSLPERPNSQPKSSAKDVDLSADDVKAHLQKRAARMRSLVVDYDVNSEAHVEPVLLIAWGMHVIRDYSQRQIVGFTGDKQLSRHEEPRFQAMYGPLDKISVAPNAPKDVAGKVEGLRKSMAAGKSSGMLTHLWHFSEFNTKYSFFDGAKCFGGPSAESQSPQPTSAFDSPVMYLANIGLRPIPPEPPPAAWLPFQQTLRLPDALAVYSMPVIRRKTERIDNVECIVLEGEWTIDLPNFKMVRRKDILFLDPTIGYAPRRWEEYANGTLQSMKSNREYEEYAPGYWLPRECVWTRYAPSWLGDQHRGQPGYSYVMKLRRAYCGAEAARFFPK